ncbi:HNH endonuclease [Ruegeria atlantica]|uniref:HNH nuclease domain-containing protein n=1 Tax=Ruegeria atlantica TaxID=81569 RepID=A0A0P1E0Z7_9RHOB|nr:HNH endonuclease [Ruegeria atlantica]CUH41563.1 hypothetical protein RUM4293_00437 [Ruegeria atlantica]
MIWPPGVECWRDVPDLPGYRVSNLGRVEGPRGIMTPVRRGEYLSVICGSRTDGTRKRRNIQRLVCAAWHGQPPSRYHQAAHGDGDPHNNCEWNLRWAIRLDNIADKYQHGTIRFGADNPSTRLTREKVLVALAALAGGLSKVQIAAALEVSDVAIGRIARGESWVQLASVA